jgi:uncharacterized protein (DUF1684 family)
MSSRTSVRRGVFIALIVLVVACAVYASDAAYRQSVEKWRRDYEADLKSDNGWLTVSGLFWLHEGENHFGSDPLNDIVLPASAVPASAGFFEFHDGKTTVHIDPGVVATIDGKLVQVAELKPDAKLEERLVIGNLTLWVHASGERFSIRLRNKNSELRRRFTGANWFPIDESYAVTAKYVAYDAPKKLDSQNVLGDAIKVNIVGYVTFTLKGQDYRLDAQLDPPKAGLFIVFRDLTSGKETYPAARFLDTEVPKDEPGGTTVRLDFNKAYNPPCAYNPFTTCPLPLPENRLRVEIPAGEKIYKRDHGML